MSILQVTGEIIVKVDQVLLEQTCIERPKEVEGFNTGLQVMVAALHHEDTQAFQRQISKCGHVLEYQSTEQVGDDWQVRFKVRLRTVRDDEV